MKSISIIAKVCGWVCMYWAHHVPRTGKFRSLWVLLHSGIQLSTVFLFVFVLCIRNASNYINETIAKWWIITWTIFRIFHYPHKVFYFFFQNQQNGLLWHFHGILREMIHCALKKKQIITRYNFQTFIASHINARTTSISLSHEITNFD